MQIDVKPGRYVVAVSGGVDSMVLLDVLAKMPSVSLVVAHFDHGIRPDSSQDAVLVEAAATQYRLPFVTGQGKLGPNTSEAQAREARYAFLHTVAREHEAVLITAHHADDVVETAIINILRGTGPRGLASLRSTALVFRPLLGIRKQVLLEFAAQNHINWREDSTNADTRYLRNYVRAHIMPRLGEMGFERLTQIAARAVILQADIDLICAELRQAEPGREELRRQEFIMLPHSVAREYLADWLRRAEIPFDRPTLERLVMFIKTARPGKVADVKTGYQLEAGRTTVRIRRGRVS